jgi:hypothetical protein
MAFAFLNRDDPHLIKEEKFKKLSKREYGE